MNKERLKGMVIGFVMCAVLTVGIATVASTQRFVREITYGVRVTLDGQELQFAEDMRPFIMGVRTFLSVRALSEALGIAVDYDPATHTVHLGNRFAGQRVPLRHAAPFFDRNPNAGSNSWTAVWFGDTVHMGGQEYSNALNFRRAANSAGTQFTLHNLNGQYRMFSGYMGRVDGTRMDNVTVNIFGDGNLLQSHSLRATDMPIPFSVFVEGVQQLRLEVVFPADRNAVGWDRSNSVARSVLYAIVGYLE